MNLKIILISVLFVFNISNIFSANCGGNITCNCGDLVTRNYNLNSNLKCHTLALALNSNVKLNCQNYKINGFNSGAGLQISAKDNIEIKNCNINNFKFGISIKSNYIWYDYGYVYHWLLKDSYNNNINNNKLNNNEYGIYTQNDQNTKIYKNSFKNNSINSIYSIGHSKNTIWNNIFYDSGIYFKLTSGKSFCKNNISNIFYNDSIKQECDCIRPVNNLVVDSKVKFCKGKYFLPNGLKFHSNANLDCQGSKIYGLNKGTGIFVGGSKTSINNCSISNYRQGILYYSYVLYDALNYRYNTPSILNSITNSKIYNVDKGIYFSTFKHYGNWMDSWATNIKNNQILGGRYSILNNNNGIVNVKNNYWGTNNESLIRSKFYKPNKVEFIPFIKTKKSDYSLNKKNLILNPNNLKFIIKKSPILNLNKIEIEIIKINNNSILNDSYFNITDLINENIFVNLNYSINYNDNIIIVFDPKNKISDIDLSNNYISKKFTKKDLIFINSSLNFKFLNDEINLYFKEIFGTDLISNNYSNAKFILNIKKENKITSFDNIIPNQFQYQFDYLKNPYEGKIISKEINNKKIINLSGVDIDGVLASIKIFSKNSIFLKNQSNYTYIINKTNIKAIKIYDYLHNYKNNIFYNQNNNNFKNIIDNILFDNLYTFKLKQIPIIVNNKTINYSLKIFKSELSSDFKKFQNNDSYPIILSGGLWSNIDSWLKDAKKLSNLGYDTYLIELSGGVNLECNNCYNYNYSFLKNIVYPKYINYILNLTSAKKIKIIGHSNGARISLDSIRDKKINSSKIDTFISVGMSGSFEKLSYFGNLLNNSGKLALKRIINKNITHVSFSRVAHELNSKTGELFSLFSYLFTTEFKISTNLFEKYLHFITSKNDSEPGINTSINYFTLIYGNYKNSNSDLIVPINDSINIFNNIISKHKTKVEVNKIHVGMTQDNEIFNILLNSLNKNIYLNNTN